MNKQGAEVDNIKGGMAGSSILTCVLRLEQELEIRPGIVGKDSTGRNKCKSIFSRGGQLLDFAVTGGLIGVGTRIDLTQWSGSSRWMPLWNCENLHRAQNKPLPSPPVARCQNRGQDADQGVQALKE